MSMNPLLIRRYYGASGSLMHWTGSCVFLDTEAEQAAEESAISARMAAQRAQYPQVFAALDRGRSVSGVFFSGVMPDYYSASSVGTVGYNSRFGIRAFSETDELPKSISLPGSAILWSGTEDLYRSALRVARTGLGYQSYEVLRSGPPAYMAIRLESEPSTKRAHTFHTEPNENNTPIQPPASDLEDKADIALYSDELSIAGTLFIEGVRVTPPKELAPGDAYGPSAIRPRDLDVFYRDVATAWAALAPEQMANAEYDLRTSVNQVDRGVGREYWITTKRGTAIVTEFDLGAAIHEQYPTGAAFFSSVDLEDKISMIAYWRDPSGKKITVSHTVPHDDTTFNVVFDSDKILYQATVEAHSATMYTILQPRGGPYAMVDKTKRIDNVTTAGIVIKNEAGYFWNYSFAYPPVILSEGQGAYEGTFVDIVDTIDANLLLPGDALTGVCPSAGGSAYVGGVAHALITERPPAAFIPPGGGTWGGVIYNSPLRKRKLVSASYTPEPGESWVYPPPVLIPPGANFDQFGLDELENGLNAGLHSGTHLVTVNGGAGRIRRIGDDPSPLYPHFFQENEAGQFNLSNLPQPRGAHAAVVMHPQWTGYIVPRFGDFTEFAIHTEKQPAPSGTITPDGSVRFSFGPSTDYTVDILELFDGTKRQRFPVYRAPEKMLNSPTMQLDPSADFVREGNPRTITPVIENRTVTADLPQGYLVFVSRFPRGTEQKITYTSTGLVTTNTDISRVNLSLVSSDAVECPGGVIPAHISGFVYVQVVDTYYCEMQEIAVNL